MLTIDTSALLTLMNRKDPHHAQVKAAFLHEPEPRFVPAGILSEAASLIDVRFRAHALDRFLIQLEHGTLTLDCGEGDIPRIRKLVRRYSDLPLGFADASVVACAERSGGKVLTLDVRDFGVVAREGRIQVLPASE